MKICSIIVSFNRLPLLKEGVRGVLSQTYPLDKIFIVDNGSTDGTKEWLESIDNEKIEVIFQDNVGCAGGMHTGIKKAFEEGYDWFWLMDDDVEPQEDCLEVLLKYKEVSECLHPLRVYQDGEVCVWEHYYNPFTSNYLPMHNVSFKNKDICFVNVGCFEGMLISRRIVEKIGYPNKDYFIAGDDTEYGFLASLYTNVSYIKPAVLKRKKNRKEDMVLRPFYLYYFLRNKHLSENLVNKVFGDKVSNLSKNIRRATLRSFIMYFRIILLEQKNKKALLKSLYRAYKDYRKGLKGKTY